MDKLQADGLDKLSLKNECRENFREVTKRENDIQIK